MGKISGLKGGKPIMRQKQHRDRKKLSFLQRYGITLLSWVEWKRTHTGEEIMQKIIKATR